MCVVGTKIPTLLKATIFVCLCCQRYSLELVITSTNLTSYFKRERNQHRKNVYSSFPLYPELAASQMIQKWLQWSRSKILFLILSLHFNIILQACCYKLRLGRLLKAFLRPKYSFGNVQEWHVQAGKALKLYYIYIYFIYVSRTEDLLCLCCIGNVFEVSLTISKQRERYSC